MHKRKQMQNVRGGKEKRLRGSNKKKKNCRETEFNTSTYLPLYSNYFLANGKNSLQFCR